MIDYLWATVLRIDWMALLLIVALAGITYTLYKAHTNPERFDLRTVVQKEDGTVSLHKMGQLTALVVSTWAFVYLVLRGQLTETFYLTYMGVWASTEIANKVANRFGQSSAPPPPPTTDQGQAPK